VDEGVLEELSKVSKIRDQACACFLPSFLLLSRSCVALRNSLCPHFENLESLRCRELVLLSSLILLFSLCRQQEFGSSGGVSPRINIPFMLTEIGLASVSAEVLLSRGFVLPNQALQYLHIIFLYKTELIL
jgi:hypothetical protein